MDGWVDGQVGECMMDGQWMEKMDGWMMYVWVMDGQTDEEGAIPPR